MDFEMLFTFTLSIAGVLMLWAAISDARTYKIPNAVSLGLLALFPLFVYAAPTTIAWQMHLAVFAAFFIVGYLVYLKNWAGAGDIKFLASIGLWAGPEHALKFLFITALAGGILAMAFGTMSVLRAIKNNAATPASPDALPASQFSKTPLPYGIAIAVGGLCTLALLSHPALLAAKV